MAMEPFLESTPFLDVQNHLHHSGVDVPAVIAKNPSAGWILLEDCGDEVLLRRLMRVSDSETERKLYENVIDNLITLHTSANKKNELQPPPEAFHLCFNTEKLMWEVDFTLEHFYLGLMKRNLSNSILTSIRTDFEKICSQLANIPTVFTHRDFHSRNVMILDRPKPRTIMIDFQDARMGPPQYDLASLLRDSYYQLDESQIYRLVDYYIARFDGISGKKLNRNEFIYHFDLMSVQRNFKAIGSFASFMVKKNNGQYLKFIGNTFENIRRTLLKYPEFNRLRETLFEYYYF